MVPSGQRSRVDANIAALRVLRACEAESRPATSAEQTVLSRWSSWGAVPQVFDEARDEWAGDRAILAGLFSEEQFAQARRTVLNAHYTDPRYVASVWDAVAGLGVESGRVLEPGSGSGTFIGLAPSGYELTGVELDETTARISQLLYPQATIHAQSFADTKIPDGFFDATVGNVPFADLVLHDPIDNANGHSLHNHFILKSLRATRPGGIVAVLTSHYTLDAGNPAARREMGRYADLIGAVRLPSGAHRRTAGTEALTDVLIFRRREPGTEPADTAWESVTPRTVGEQLVKINSYFDSRPEHILGELTTEHGMYGAQSLHVRSDLATVDERLRGALEQIVTSATERGLRATARTASAGSVVDQLPALDEWDGTIRYDEATGTFTTATRQGPQPLKVPASASRELRALLQLRDGAVRQLELERASLDDSDEIVAARAELKASWEGYVARFGPINRYTLSGTGRTGEDGEPILARRMPTAPRLLRDDPFGPLVFALEVFDDESQEAHPAAMMSRRVILPRPEKLGADTAAEALQISLHHDGRVDLDYIASLLGDTVEQARAQLGTLVYDDPDTGQLLTAAEYLSGVIPPKLDAARAAAETDDRYRVNVRALEQVLPTPLTPEEITARPGAVWISAAHHQQFLRELVADPSVTVTNPLPGTWQVRGGVRRSIRATSEWGTERRSAHDLLEQLANQSQIRVDDKIRDVDGTERSVFNPTETTAAQEKADLIRERFEEWVWEDPERAAELAAEYNRRFNGIVLRDYTAEGETLTLPGMVASFELRAHQKTAVARMVSEPAVGLFHEVGAGKTAEMVAGAMELRRRGMVNKVGVVVPNHMLEQFTREWLQLYPQARILAANTDTLSGDKRRIFVARAAANDWDAIILTREAFKRLPVEPDTMARYIDNEVDTLRHGLANLDSEDRLTVKQIEKRIAAAEETQKRLLDAPRDAGITFESTGIDYLIVDEIHDYKNLATVSRIRDANITGSARATDLAVKLDYLRRTHGERVITGATATPIANSITEAHVMQRLLRPDLLRDAGVESFDAWAATFGETVDEVEMAPQGGESFRLKTRFARFRNVPEMLRMWHVFADVKTAEDLDLPTPPLRMRADGRRAPETIAIDPSPEVLDYVRQLGERADKVAAKQVSPDQDNMLKISGDGRKAALDIRMVDDTAIPTSVPLAVVADNIARIHREHQDDVFTDPRTGEESPLRGALQIVFCDLGTPNKDRWNVYDELKAQLVTRGVPEGGIRFAHEAKNDKEKARLFAAAREGRVAVLIGSTSKMGVGTNVQLRAVALHDVDCPWRPADVAQRHGRIERQGNQNAEIEIYQYVVKQTFAAYMWQAIERKSRFINQVMRGRLDVREINDLGSDSLTAAEAKALASGNPLLLARSTALNETSRLERLERAYHRNQRTLRATITALQEDRERVESRIAQLEAAKPRALDLSGDRFRITINGREYTSRVDAQHAIATWATSAGLQWARPVTDDRARGELGTISSFPLQARTLTDAGIVQLHISIEGLPGVAVRVNTDRALDPADLGILRSLEHRIATVDEQISRARTDLASIDEAHADAERGLDAPFKHRDALHAARARLDSIDQALTSQAEPEPRPQAPTAPAADTGPHTGPASPIGTGPSLR
ncbi:DEAD/DEAH box helicase family protein [Microbacterium sp. VKM Ac-2870]|uniref:DEAD/DEAH box helicase family protein n=1 Tax=Microbacterium sp. VKM Ac-2870 TaxID=2783825 RepID=UPI001E5D5507|nr:DEAD/DEAH box helicase family protein [Microbacterium sp. VKM Ac-2870]